MSKDVVVILQIISAFPSRDGQPQSELNPRPSECANHPVTNFAHSVYEDTSNLPLRTRQFHWAFGTGADKLTVAVLPRAWSSKRIVKQRQESHRDRGGTKSTWQQPGDIQGVMTFTLHIFSCIKHTTRELKRCRSSHEQETIFGSCKKEGDWGSFQSRFTRPTQRWRHKKPLNKCIWNEPKSRH
jgi:hypothetical protein